MVRSTGYEEVALSSLSSGDYSAIGELIQDLSADLAGEGFFIFTLFAFRFIFPGPGEAVAAGAQKRFNFCTGSGNTAPAG